MWMILVFSLFSGEVCAIQLDVDPSQKIYDYAEILTPAEEEELVAKSESLTQQYEMDYVIVTISDDEDMSSVDYAQDFYDYNAFAPDGLLLLINMDYRELVICGTGKGEYIYNESQIEKMLDYVYEGAAEGDFYAASTSFLEQAEKIAARAAETPLERNIRRIPFFILGGALIGGIIMSFLISPNKLRRTPPHASHYMNGRLQLTHHRDHFVRSAVTRTPRNTNHGGGRHFGGSSVGSSGRSHSVGRRKF
jgi:uncharacterized protein